jgi:hypothetical protein
MNEPTYLDPNRNTMQKLIGGRSVMAVFSKLKHIEIVGKIG